MSVVYKFSQLIKQQVHGGWFARVTLLTLFVSIFTACDGKPASQHYFTWDGLEPDKWGSIWLLKRHIDPDSKLSIVPVGATVNNAIAVDTPYAKYKRSHGRATFENMVLAFGKDSDPALIKIGSIINELEVTSWGTSSPIVAVVENRFRELQHQHNRVDVPVECYSGFYDQLYSVLKNNLEPDLEHVAAMLAPEKVCATPATTIAQRSDDPVHEYGIDHILKMIHANRKVVFVDTRENDEYDEHHIPGAVNLTLRDVNKDTVKQFADADLVISYCVKDFRGYEVALALHKAGVKNSSIMKPYGIKGWKQKGLPVAKQDEKSDAQALARLKECAATGQCGKS